MKSLLKLKWCTNMYAKYFYKLFSIHNNFITTIILIMKEYSVNESEMFWKLFQNKRMKCHLEMKSEKTKSKSRFDSKRVIIKRFEWNNCCVNWVKFVKLLTINTTPESNSSLTDSFLIIQLNRLFSRHCGQTFLQFIPKI